MADSGRIIPFSKRVLIKRNPSLNVANGNILRYQNQLAKFQPENKKEPDDYRQCGSLISPQPSRSQKPKRPAFFDEYVREVREIKSPEQKVATNRRTSYIEIQRSIESFKLLVPKAKAATNIQLRPKPKRSTYSQLNISNPTIFPSQQIPGIRYSDYSQDLGQPRRTRKTPALPKQY